MRINLQFTFSKECSELKISINAKHEINNFIISSAAIVLAVLSFVVSVSSGATHRLSIFIDKILIQLGLVPAHLINKMMINPGIYSYVSINKATFIILNLALGFIALMLITKRGTKYSGWIYSTSMTLVFLLVSSILTIQSGDPFNWICVMFGFPVTLFIQLLLAAVVLKRNKSNISL